jgi:hypothetical protein
MDYDETLDPNFVMSVFKWDTTQNIFPEEDLQISKHIWTGDFSKSFL